MGCNDMGLKLTVEQADLMAEKAVWRVESIMESAHDGGADSLLAELDKIDPLRSAIKELRDNRTAADLDLLQGMAGEILSERRESTGDCLATIHQVRSGYVVEFQSDAESPDEIIKREEDRAEGEAKEAALAQQVVWAVRHAVNQVKASEGDRRAQESVQTQERWDEENRPYVEAASL